MNTELIAYCGLYCGACDWHMSFPKAGTEEIAPDALKRGTCPGCRDKANICGFCGIKKCAVEKGLEFCGKCREYPCAAILAFANDGKPHHADIPKNLSEIERLGGRDWAKTQQRRWSCRCGTKFSWYDKKCPACNGEVAGY